MRNLLKMFTALLVSAGFIAFAPSGDIAKELKLTKGRVSQLVKQLEQDRTGNVVQGPWKPKADG